MTELTIRTEIGARIKELRLAQNLTQQQLADLAKLTRAKICNIEAGKYSVGLDVLYRISEALNVSIQLINISTMATITNLTPNIRTIEHSYVANNHRCLDYAVLYTRNGEERFCGYTRSNTLSSIVGEVPNYDTINRHYDQNATMPEWVKDVIK